MMRIQLNQFLRNPQNIDCFDSFTFNYLANDGSEEIFKLLKGKKEVIKQVDLKKIQKKRDYYTLVEKELDEYVRSINSR